MSQPQFLKIQNIQHGSLSLPKFSEQKMQTIASDASTREMNIPESQQKYSLHFR